MFQGLSTALTALYADRQALETAGNNIANVNTEGYSRQRVELQSLGGNLSPSFWAQSSRVGYGVSIQDITRIRDAFLESRGLQEHSTLGEMKRTQNVMQSMELSFGEPSDNGLQAQLAEYWAVWDDVANKPDDLAARSQVVEQGNTLASYFSQTAISIRNMKQSTTDGLKSNISSLNTMAQSVADLNRAIQSAVNSGSSPNALFDQRDAIVNKMADLAGVRVEPTASGSIAVMIGGIAIVRDDRANRLQVDESGANIVLRWDTDNNAATTTDGFPADLKGGDTGALMTALNVTIPKYLNLLNNVAADLISTVNTQHQLGIDQNGDPGIAFFTGTDAFTIGVSATLAADTRLVAAGASGGGPVDGENARLLANFAELQGGPDAEYRRLADIMGVEAQRANRQLAIQSEITNAVDASRQAASGVNLDEEMTNMVRFQKSYSAAAKYLTVMDEVLETLINIVR